MKRKDFILQEIENNPNNPMNHYFLAMEYKSEGDIGASIITFELLCSDFPSYLPTYYTFGNYLITLGKYEEAKVIILKGILTIEQSVGNTKALHELKQLFEIYF